MDNLQSLPIDDFSQGMTDFTVGGAITQNNIIKNMYIDENRDLITRNGSRPKFEYQITSTETPQTLIRYSDDYLVQAEDKLYSLGASSATAINVVGGSDAFTGAGASTKVYQNEWNDNVIFTSSDLIYPLKCWKNESSTFKLERLGLPHILLNYLIPLANELKSDYNAHIADTGEHSSAGTNTITSADADDLDSLLTLTQELLTKYTLHLANSSIHPGSVAAGDSLESAEIFTIYGAASALTDMKTKYNQHDNDSTAHTSGGGSHQITTKSTRSELISGTAGGNTYLYAIHYKYTYYTSNKTFIENSDVLYLEIASIAAPDSNAITLTLPALSSLDEYNISNIKVAIFRTFNGGQDFFKVDEVDASTATYSDSKSDDDIENNAPIYTSGNILPDEPPPKAEFSVQVGGILVLGNIKDGRLSLPNFITISKPNRIYSFPSSFRLEFEQDVKGLGFINTYPIAFLDSKIYRVEGNFDSSGQGFLRKRMISDTVGTVSHKSIVNTKLGVFFAAVDGFYFTDGFNLRKISTDINHTYDALGDIDDIEGTYDKLNNRVMWTSKRDTSSSYNDSIFVAHLDYPSIKEGFAFTFLDGGENISNFYTTGVSFDNDSTSNNLLRLHPSGYLIYHDDSFSDDSFVNTSKTPDLWDTETIFYQIDTVDLDFRNSKIRKWVPKLNINARNVSALSLQIQSANDTTNSFVNLKEIIDQSNLAWGDPSIEWGDPSVLWNLIPTISAWRYFPAIRQSIRCMFKQLRFKNAYITIDGSASLGEVEVVASSNTITLNDHPTVEWASNLVNYFVSFAHESYAFDYKVTAISGADITVADPSNTLTDSGSTEFLIKGYKKGEILNLSNYVLSYAPITQVTVSTEQGNAS